jgi:hypothetical protein
MALHPTASFPLVPPFTSAAGEIGRCSVACGALTRTIEIGILWRIPLASFSVITEGGNMLFRIIAVMLFVWSLTASNAYAQANKEPNYGSKEKFVEIDGVRSRYLVLSPAGLKKDTPAPVWIGLHGVVGAPSMRCGPGTTLPTNSASF